MTPRRASLTERRIAAAMMGVLALALVVATVLYTLKIIESGAPVLILGLGGLAVILIAARYYFPRKQ